MRKFLLLGVLAAASAFTAPVLTVIPTLGPDFGFAGGVESPNFDAWAANVITGLQANSMTAGTSGTVTYYQGIASGSTVAGNEFISSPFDSWKGVACGANPDCQFTGEKGTAMYFSLHILGDAQNTFTLEQLSVSEIYLGQASGHPAGTFTGFGNTLYGRLANGTVVSAGAANGQALTELWYVGVGFVQGIDPALTGTNQQILDGTWAAILAGKTQTQVCYTVGLATGCGSVNIGNVPEPGTMVLLGAGLAGLALLRRRSA